VNNIVPIENIAAESKWVKQQNAVFDDYAKGEQDPTKLAKKHGITRAQAIQMVDEVKAYMRSSGIFKELAKERLGEMDYHYSLLMKKGHNAVEELEANGNWDKVPAALKVIGDLESKRQETLQKAGVYEDYEVGDMLAEAEAKVAAVSDLLKRVIAQFPETKTMIITGLRDIQDPDRLPDPEVIEGKTV
jgi:hypothetical protein